MASKRSAYRRAMGAAVAASAAALAPAPRRGLLHLLNQRTVQTQVYYLTSFHNEAKGNWLATFGDPEVTMACERISDRSVQPVYHGLDAFCGDDDEDPADYLRSMMAEDPVTFQVRYLVGTPEGAPAPADASEAPDGFAEQCSSAMSMWGANAAAASRRRNPYLNDAKRYIEYDETVDPMKMARMLMRTREQLAREWAWDLKKLLQDDGAPEARDEFGLVAQPPGLDEDASPLRHANLDLCARLATRAAAVEAVKHASAAEARYLTQQLAPELEGEAEKPKPTPTEDPGAISRELSAVAAKLSGTNDTAAAAPVDDADPGALSRELAAAARAAGPDAGAMADRAAAVADDEEEAEDPSEDPEVAAYRKKLQKAASGPRGDGGSLSRELAEAACRLQRQSDALGDHCAKPGKADKWLDGLNATSPFSASGSRVDPPALVRTILGYRDAILRDWIEHVNSDVVEEHTGLCREALEASLKSPEAEKPPEASDDAAGAP